MIELEFKDGTIDINSGTFTLETSPYGKFGITNALTIEFDKNDVIKLYEGLRVMLAEKGIENAD